MCGIRNRARVFAAVALVFQVGTIAAAAAVISCDSRPSIEHGAHDGMVDCPMQKQEPACPLHAEKHGTHDCDCPSLGCSQTDTAFTALLGAVGVLSPDASFNVPRPAGDAAPLMVASENHLAPVPFAPPPRA